MSFLALFLTLFGLKLVQSGHELVKKWWKTWSKYSYWMCLPKEPQKDSFRIALKIQFFFWPFFWPNLAFFGPNIWSVVFSVDPNCYIPPSNNKCNVYCDVIVWHSSFQFSLVWAMSRSSWFLLAFVSLLEVHDGKKKLALRI